MRQFLLTLVAVDGDRVFNCLKHNWYSTLTQKGVTFYAGTVNKVQPQTSIVVMKLLKNVNFTSFPNRVHWLIQDNR